MTTSAPGPAGPDGRRASTTSFSERLVGDELGNADRAAAALRVAETSDLPIWRALATVLSGAATSAGGRPEEGIRQMADGLNQDEGLRTPPVFWPMIRFMQAAAHVDAGTPEPGFELIDEALTLGGPDGVLAPQFHIVRGDLSLLGPGADLAAATRAGSIGRRRHSVGVLAFAPGNLHAESCELCLLGSELLGQLTQKALLVS